MKAKQRKLAEDLKQFCEACQAGHVANIGGRLVSMQHPGGCPTMTREHREARPGGRVLVEDYRGYKGTDVRTLAGPEGQRMIPMSPADADAVLARFGLSRPRDTRPLALAESAPHENTRKLQDARAAGKRGTPSAVTTLLERLDRVDEPVGVEAARDLARRRLGGGK